MIILEAIQGLLSRSATPDADAIRSPWWSWASASGVNVTPEVALTCSAVFCAVNVISRAEAALPLVTHRRLKTRGKERARDHHLYGLIHDRPNPEMSSFAWREAMLGHILTWGNGYCEIERNNGGRPLALWPLRPDRVKPKRSTNKEIGLYYDVCDRNGKVTPLLAENILHFHGLSFDGIVGYSPIHVARESLGLILAAEKYGSSFYKNDSSPGGVLEHPNKLSPEAHASLKKSWEDLHKGLDNAHRIAILEEGMKWTQVGLPPRDAQFLQTRQFQIAEVARWFNLPPHKLKDLTRSTFSNIEQQSIEFVTDSLLPWLISIEQEMDYKLLTDAERGQYFIKHVVDGLLRGDIASRYAAYAIGRQWGWLSSNDVRELENMNPLPDKQGDLYMVPLNMSPADQISTTPGKAARLLELLAGDTPAPDPAPIREAYRHLLTDCAGRIVRKEVSALRRALKKRQGLPEFIEAFYAEQRDYVREVIAPSLLALMTSVGRVMPPGLADALAVRYVRASMDLITPEIRRDPEEFENLLTRWERERPSELAEMILADTQVKGD